MGSADNFSTFKVTSFGNEDMPNDVASAPIGVNTLYQLQERLWELQAKMEELYNRPRMPYTYDAEIGDFLELQHEPEWRNDKEPPVLSDSTTVYSLLGFATGIRKDINKHPRVIKTKQPIRHVTTTPTTSGGTETNTVSTTTTTVTSTPFTTTTLETETAFGDWFDVFVRHRELNSTGVPAWVTVSSFTTIFWNDPPGSPGTFTNIDTITETVTLETTTTTD